MRLHSFPLRKRVVCLGLIDSGEQYELLSSFPTVFRVKYRHKCWELGAFTSTSLEDPVITHLLVPKSFPREGQVNLVCENSSCFNRIRVSRLLKYLT